MLILKIKPRQSGFCVWTFSDRECWIIETENDRENGLESQKVEFRIYAKLAFLYGRRAWTNVWKEISTPETRETRWADFHLISYWGILWKFRVISNDIQFIQSLTTTIFWNAVTSILVDRYQPWGGMWDRLLRGFLSKCSVRKDIKVYISVAWHSCRLVSIYSILYVGLFMLCTNYLTENQWLSVLDLFCIWQDQWTKRAMVSLTGWSCSWVIININLPWKYRLTNEG
jgi:hypothetical protein